MQEPGQGPGEVQKEPPQVAPEAEEGRVEDEEEEVEGALAVEEEGHAEAEEEAQGGAEAPAVGPGEVLGEEEGRPQGLLEGGGVGVGEVGEADGEEEEGPAQLTPMAAAMPRPNCWKIWPMRPGRKLMGRKTARRLRVAAATAALTSLAPLSTASLRPSPMRR